MVFTSIVFLIFLPIVWGLYWFKFESNLRLRNLLILVSSCVFYGWWDKRFLILLLATSLIDFYVALALENTEIPQKRKQLIAISLITNLGSLFFFKYFNFFTDSFYQLATSLGLSISPFTLNIVLPVGISFYTFQTLSYTIDVYYRKLSATKDIVAFLAFVSFFPQLVAGPIERAKHLLPQFFEKHSFKYEQAVSGLQLILWGFFKKMVIADRLAIFTDEVYKTPTTQNGFSLLLATIFFTFQIYCDFSGYSDIAIGTARLFGFELMTNFKTPYFSTSIREFWRRWHISLSTWFRDYVYVPMGGSQVSKSWEYFALFITFLISGIWHGANLTFMIWGIIHGFAIILERVLPSFCFIPRWIKGFFVFSFVCITWIFFRAKNLHDAIFILQHLDISTKNIHATFGQLFHVYGSQIMLWYIGFNFLVFMLFEVFMGQKSIDTLLISAPKSVQWASYYLLFILLILFAVYDNAPNFIYFQF